MIQSFKLQPFRPALGLASGHSQSLVANLLRRRPGISFRRQRLDTADGDFVDLDFPYWLGSEPPGDARLVLLLHGLEGSARRGYARECYYQLAQYGVASAGLNFRSCSGELNRTARLYHAGDTADVALALDYLTRQWPDRPLGLVGFSLGANVLLNYVGQPSVNGRLQAAVAISCPFDLMAGARFRRQGLARLYERRLLRRVQHKAAAHPQLRDRLDMAQVAAIETLIDFDNAVTAPLHGFADALDYYGQASPARHLPAIRIPTLILRARDDPMFPDDIPYATLASNPALEAGLPPQGGHVGFVEGLLPWLRFWAERQAARFFAAQFQANGHGSTSSQPIG